MNRYYITVKLPPMYHQMSLEELFFGGDSFNGMVTPNLTNTRTYEVRDISYKFRSKVNVRNLIQSLERFNAQTEYLREVERHTLYRTFKIPKKNGRDFRVINAPNDNLMIALRNLKTIFEDDFGALYHTSAFAYIRKRCTIDAVKRHQANESKWFGKYDLHNFFGSTTLQFVMDMFSMVFPFSEVMRNEEGKKALETALELAFLDGGLPQGTPISPIITNVMMIPIDYQLSNKLRDYNNQKFIYTRYADDFLISSRYTFSFREIENVINSVLKEYNAPFMINASKTRYGSSAGSNWNLGVMLNSQNQITVGYKRKKQFETMLSNYVLDRQNGTPWETDRIQSLEGMRSYFHMVEGETIDKIVEHVGKKYGVDIIKCIKQDLKS